MSESSEAFDHSTSASPRDWRGRLLRVAEVSGRATLVIGATLIVAFLAYGAGAAIGAWAVKSNLPGTTGAAAVAITGVGAILALAKEALGQVPKLVEFINKGKFADAWAVFALVGTGSLTAGVASELPRSPDQSKDAAIVNLVQYLHLPDQPAAESGRHFVVPFLKEAKGCDETGAAFKDGHKLTDTARKEFLPELMNGLRHCGKDRPVVLEIRGFASSQPFKGCPNSDELNRKLANHRACAVYFALADLDYEGQGCPADRSPLPEIEMRAIQWKPGEAASMRSALGFNDRDLKGNYWPERAILTRRADVTLVDAGGCKTFGVTAIQVSSGK
jgi:hypothetical protein